MPGCLLLLVLVSILWSPVIRASQGGQLCVYAQAVSSYPQPPVAAAFIMGCFWTRTNRKVAWPPGGGRGEWQPERGPGDVLPGVSLGWWARGRVLPGLCQKSNGAFILMHFVTE